MERILADEAREDALVVDVRQVAGGGDVTALWRACEESVAVRGARSVEWSAEGVLRKKLTTPHAISQVLLHVISHAISQVLLSCHFSCHLAGGALMSFLMPSPRCCSHVISHAISQVLLSCHFSCRLPGDHCSHAVSQAAWVRMHGEAARSWLALLHADGLALAATNGDMHEMPLPFSSSRLWPLPIGLLLQPLPSQPSLPSMPPHTHAIPPSTPLPIHPLSPSPAAPFPPSPPFAFPVPTAATAPFPSPASPIPFPALSSHTPAITPSLPAPATGTTHLGRAHMDSGCFTLSHAHDELQVRELLVRELLVRELLVMVLLVMVLLVMVLLVMVLMLYTSVSSPFSLILSPYYSTTLPGTILNVHSLPGTPPLPASGHGRRVTMAAGRVAMEGGPPWQQGGPEEVLWSSTEVPLLPWSRPSSLRHPPSHRPAHPFPGQPVGMEGGPPWQQGGWGEEVLWSSTEVPLLATFNHARRQHSVWHLRYLPQRFLHQSPDATSAAEQDALIAGLSPVSPATAAVRAAGVRGAGVRRPGVEGVGAGGGGSGGGGDAGMVGDLRLQAGRGDVGGSVGSGGRRGRGGAAGTAAAAKLSRFAGGGGDGGAGGGVGGKAAGGHAGSARGSMEGQTVGGGAGGRDGGGGEARTGGESHTASSTALHRIKRFLLLVDRHGSLMLMHGPLLLWRAPCTTFLAHHGIHVDQSEFATCPLRLGAGLGDRVSIVLPNNQHRFQVKLAVAAHLPARCLAAIRASPFPRRLSHGLRCALLAPHLWRLQQQQRRGEQKAGERVEGGGGADEGRRVEDMERERKQEGEREGEQGAEAMEVDGEGDRGSAGRGAQGGANEGGRWNEAHAGEGSQAAAGGEGGGEAGQSAWEGLLGSRHHRHLLLAGAPPWMPFPLPSPPTSAHAAPPRPAAASSAATGSGPGGPRGGYREGVQVGGEWGEGGEGVGVGELVELLRALHGMYEESRLDALCRSTLPPHPALPSVVPCVFTWLARAAQYGPKHAAPWLAWMPPSLLSAAAQPTLGTAGQAAEKVGEEEVGMGERRGREARGGQGAREGRGVQEGGEWWEEWGGEGEGGPGLLPLVVGLFSLLFPRGAWSRPAARAPSKARQRPAVGGRAPGGGKAGSDRGGGKAGAAGAESGGGGVVAAAGEHSVAGVSERCVAAMVAARMGRSDLQRLPPAVALPLLQALHVCRENPPPGWPAAAYVLVGRDDLAATATACLRCFSLHHHSPLPHCPSPHSHLSSTGEGSTTATFSPHTTASPHSPHSLSPLAFSFPPTVLVRPLSPFPSSPHPALHPSLALPGSHASQGLASASGVGVGGMGAGAGSGVGVAGVSDAAGVGGGGAGVEGAGGEGMVVDGMEHLLLPPARSLLALRFPCDLRLAEVSTGRGAGVVWKGGGREGGEGMVVDGMEHLLLPPARSLLALCFPCDLRLAEVGLDGSLGNLSELATWPEFHNGVAAGLKLAHLFNLSLLQAFAPARVPALLSQPAGHGDAGMGGWCATGQWRQAVRTAWCCSVESTQKLHPCLSLPLPDPHQPGTVTRAWVVYNRPSEASSAHGGLLMALGLRGHLRVLAPTDFFRDLALEHEATTVGVLLGAAASYRATMDANICKMLYLHIPSRHPPSFPDLELPPSIQTAALVGVGLLHMESAHRLTTEILLDEIGRKPEGEGSMEREGYSLGAGLALGLVTLGFGFKVWRFICAVLGVAFHMCRSGCGVSYVPFWVWRFICAVLAPGAILALAMMYLQSNNEAVAARLAPPATHFALEFVRPDFILLRVLARSLILWDRCAHPLGQVRASSGTGARILWDRCAHPLGQVRPSSGTGAPILWDRCAHPLGQVRPSSGTGAPILWDRCAHPLGQVRPSSGAGAPILWDRCAHPLGQVRPSSGTGAPILWDRCAHPLGQVRPSSGTGAPILWDRCAHPLGQVRPSSGTGAPILWGRCAHPLGQVRPSSGTGAPILWDRCAHPLGQVRPSSGTGAPILWDRCAHPLGQVRPSSGTGLRYAGSANGEAEKLLRSYALLFFFLRERRPVTAGCPFAVPLQHWRALLDARTLDTAVNAAVLSLSLVMAGTGHLPSLRLLRFFHRRTADAADAAAVNAATTYGSHMAVSMAIGFLALSACQATFSTSPPAVAALLLALFPHFPSSPSDHRCHLQALRHFWVLAVEERAFVEAVDVDTWQPVIAPLHLTLKPSDSSSPAALSLHTPCLLPPLPQGGSGGGAAEGEGGGHGSRMGEESPPASARSMAAALPVADPVLSAFHRLFCRPSPHTAVQPRELSSHEGFSSACQAALLMAHAAEQPELLEVLLSLATTCQAVSSLPHERATSGPALPCLVSSFQVTSSGPAFL
ncbi:unnamed protein product [Closterium sp. Yama58-4]|nr:unnamed protein product [Closterium sp. Yama58-4]